MKWTILRILEAPIKEVCAPTPSPTLPQVGMESPELLSLVENCPKGSETLVTR